MDRPNKQVSVDLKNNQQSKPVTAEPKQANSAPQKTGPGLPPVVKMELTAFQESIQEVSNKEREQG